MEARLALQPLGCFYAEAEESHGLQSARAQTDASSDGYCTLVEKRNGWAASHRLDFVCFSQRSAPGHNEKQMLSPPKHSTHPLGGLLGHERVAPLRRVAAAADARLLVHQPRKVEHVRAHLNLWRQ